MAISIPLPPVAKGRPRFFTGPHGRVYTPAGTERAEAAIRRFLRFSRPNLRPTAALVEARLAYYLGPRSGRTELDNLVKLTLDALAGVVYKHDGQVRQVSARMYRHAEHDSEPRTEVEIVALERWNGRD